MKKIIYKIAYNGFVNRVLRNVLYPVSKLLQKNLISISGILDVTFNGNTKFKLKTNQTCSVTQKIFYKKAENYEFSIFFSKLIKESEVFFDIGANIGYFSILGAKLNPNLKIYSFEPSIGPLKYLKDNVALNQLTSQVTVTGKAVSDVNGVLEFHSVVSKKFPWIKYNLSGSHSLQNSFGEQKLHSYEVEVISLEKFIHENNVTKIDVIKIDTECTEQYIIDSSKSVINAFRPIIICEVHDVIKKEMHDVLQNLVDYQIYELSDNQLYKMNTILDKEKSKDHFDYVFCPKEKIELIEKI